MEGMPCPTIPLPVSTAMAVSDPAITPGRKPLPCASIAMTTTTRPAPGVEHYCTGMIPALRVTILMRIALSAVIVTPSGKPFYIIGGKDYDFDNPEELSEWDKSWRGEPSALDDLDPEEEYRKSAKPKSLLDEDYKMDFSSNTDFIPLSSPDKAHKTKHSAPSSSSMLGGGRRGLIPSEQSIVDLSSFPPPPEPLLSSAPHAISHSMVPDDVDDEDEVKDRALRIAEDFVKRMNIILVGNALSIYTMAHFVNLCAMTMHSKRFSPSIEWTSDRPVRHLF